MAKATGIGGIFFRARDPDTLAKWYEEHLGITTPAWATSPGEMAFRPFRESTDYFPAGKQHMINLRVDDLAGLKTELEAKGIAVETRPDWESTEFGSFARILDPEGNPIELWQPADE